MKSNKKLVSNNNSPKKNGEVLSYVYYYVSIIFMFIMLYISVGQFVNTGNVDIHADDTTQIVKNDKLILWRFLSITNKGNIVYIQSVQEQIIDKNETVVARFYARMYNDNGQFYNFFDHEVKDSFQHQVEFFQSDTAHVKLQSDEIYKLKLIFTYRFNYFLFDRAKTKSDSNYFLLRKQDLQAIYRKIKQKKPTAGAKVGLTN